uniref:Uncharacterized protein n=1 Tax=Arcella intermedia TaxID=1963864 RepID=A0A6B2LLP5_9EUKA
MQEFKYTLAMVGEVGVGKSSLMMRFVGEIKVWDEAGFDLIGIDEKSKAIEVEGEKYQITIRDTGGQERYRNMTALHYRKAQGIVLVFDISQKSSFDQLHRWMGDVENYSGNCIKLLIGNKIDLNKRQVKKSEIEDFTNEYRNMLYREVSAKTGTGVDEAFTLLATEIKKHFDS